MFKADQVEAIKNELGLGGGADDGGIGISDTGAPIGLVDSRGASASGISLADTDPSSRSGSGSAISLASSNTPFMAGEKSTGTRILFMGCSVKIQNEGWRLCGQAADKANRRR